MDDYSLLHRQPDRLAVYEASDPIEWNDGLGTWFSADFETIQNILRDRDTFHVVNFRLIYDSFSDRFGLDFSRLVKVLDHVPLGLNGAEHVAERRAQTLYIKQAVPVAAKAFEATFDEHLVRFLDTPGEADFLVDVLLPSNTAMFLELTGLAAEKDQLRASWSQIFDRKISLNRRLKIDAQVADVLDLFRGEMSPDEIYQRVALNIVGADSIIASFAESVAFVLRDHAGQRLCDMDWPDEMPRTGVPYVDRIVARDVHLEGKDLLRGDRIRLYLDRIGLEGSAQKSAMFGIGPHVCLGKALSMRAWQHVSQSLQKQEARIELVDYRYRRSDHLFNAPEAMTIKVIHEPNS